MKIVIDTAVRRVVAGKQSAAKRLALLERLVSEGKPVPRSLLKPSGEGRTGTFTPYRMLRLSHAKLDFSGAGGGDPLLVLQQVDAETFVAIALTTHEDYATSDQTRCRKWLWDNRHAINWNVSPESEAIFEQLKDEFAPAGPAPTGSRNS